MTRPGLASLWSGRRIHCISVTLATDATRPRVMAKYFSSLLSKGAEAFRHESADQAKQHNIILVKITAKAASIGENVLGGWCS
ncbi:hypothetical protein AV530_015874 [Patagioenas fasciata monilis]|uniref:Uncharacterized protein n=1 Tax=Patagioenas fasciata monilis TaxID=372326 RepID=A0A1V4KJ86_PATFA|nr:hypothetical protein AV530_015874 [Patagioenas fasciata monilis]